MRKRRKATLINNRLGGFRKELDELINLKIRLKNTEELVAQAQDIVNIIHLAARNSTPILKDSFTQPNYYPLEIRDLIKEISPHMASIEIP